MTLGPHVLKWDTVEGLDHFNVFVRKPDEMEPVFFANVNSPQCELLGLMDLPGYVGMVVFLSVVAYNPESGIQGLPSDEIQWDVLYPAVTNLRIE